MKTDYLVLGAKLLLINMNHVEYIYIYIYINLRNFIDIKNLVKLFILVDVVD